MLKIINKFLRFISPISIVEDNLDVSKEFKEIDKKFSGKEQRVANKEAQLELHATLLQDIVALTHQAVLSAYATNLSFQRPYFARMLKENPNDEKANKQLSRWLSKWEYMKSEEVEALGADIYAVLLQRFPSLGYADNQLLK